MCLHLSVLVTRSPHYELSRLFVNVRWRTGITMHIRVWELQSTKIHCCSPTRWYAGATV